MDMRKTENVLRVEGLVKRFRKVTALDGVSFEVPKGSLTVLLGPAGAGKTTTLRALAGLEDPDGGRILLQGGDVRDVEPKDRDIGMIFDNLALYPNKTGFENIASPLLIRGIHAEEIARQVKDIAGTLRISHLLNRLPKTMSGGERQRVALGRALIRKPGLCLLDEPLSSLDAMLRMELRAELRRLQQDMGYTFVMATPDFAEALAVADTVVMLRAGKVVQVCDPQALYESPEDREVARFVGSPEINLLTASLHAISGTGPVLRVAGAALPAPSSLLALLEQDITSFELGVRPEDLRLADVANASVAGELIDIEPLGLRSALTMRHETEQIRLLVPTRQAAGLSMGQNIGIDFGEAPLLAFDSSSGRRLC